MNASDFLRLFPLRSPHIHWFLGAGASAAARVPTAYDMIWSFKHILYCANQRVPLRTCDDLSDPMIRGLLQQYFDGLGSYPLNGAEDEYAHYFEVTYPHEGDRRKYIERMVSGAEPSFGHRVLAALLVADKVRAIWTTNFDRTIEDAAAAAFGRTGQLIVAALGEPRLALEAMNEGRWPLLVKLHGDFQSRRLKNTTSELRAQDAEMRRALIQAGQRFGLAVVGYSGRDQSIMEALHEAIDGGRGYPQGLFWFQRLGSHCLPSVTHLVRSAQESGIEAHIIEMETFDELLGDLIQQVPDLPPDVAQALDRRAARVSDAPIPVHGTGLPVFRTNAVLVSDVPAVCRRVACEIGGTGEVKRVAAESGREIIATRNQFGILAFGSDEDIRACFAGYAISDYGVHPIQRHRLRYESAEFGLLYEAISRALVRGSPLLRERRRSGYQIHVDPERHDDPRLATLRKAAGALSGIVPRTDLPWTEALTIQLDFKLDRLWLLVLPTIWVPHSDDDYAANTAQEFIRERRVTRYNARWNAFLDGWLTAIFGDAPELTISALGGVEGMDAVFRLTRKTAFSRFGGTQ